MIDDYILAIDPGLSGGLVTMDMKGEIIFKWIMPVYQVKKGQNSIDLNELREIFDEIKGAKHAYLEKVSAMPGQGVSSMFKFGRVYGQLESMLAAFQIPYTLVTPQAWTKFMHVGLDKKLKPKQRSLLVFKRIYPKLDITPSERSKKPHEGLLDAILIAEYARRALCPL